MDIPGYIQIQTGDGWTVEYKLLQEISERIDVSMEAVEDVIMELESMGYVKIKRSI